MASLPQIERPSLDGRRFQVAIIGGGINGVAIARACARAGRSTLLVEQHDFASGTTSRATRIIHGGLRYLEHGEVGLVREALRERERLLRDDPHLVRPLHFFMALRAHGMRNAFFVRTGLWLYRRLGADLTGLHPASVIAESRRQLEHSLDSGRALTIFSYGDAQCEFPERLVATWLRDAVAHGATARNHTRVLAIERIAAKVRGLRLRDELSGHEYVIEADAVVNAAGPWVDQVLGASLLPSPRLIGGVRGSHIVVHRCPGAPPAALYAEGPDRRPMFVIPWNGQMLVGTTEVADNSDPGVAAPSRDEIAYLLRCVNNLFPAGGVAAADVKYAYAGVRPLPYAAGASLAAVTRRHHLHDHAHDGVAGMLSIIGGKLTTATSLARECARRLGIRVPEPERALLAGPNGEELQAVLDDWTASVAAAGDFERATAEAIVAFFGPDAQAIAQSAASSAALHATLCPHTHHIVAEAAFALEHECAVTLADVLLRRVPVALGACWSDECTQTAATRIGRAVGWDADRIASEIENFQSESSRFLRRPASAAATEGVA